MQPDRVRIALRQRSGFEAVDLGVALARRHARSLAVTWLSVVVPLAVVAMVVLWRHPFWTVVLLWWLRPAFGRIPLHVLSRSVFGEPCSVRDVLRQLPALLRPGLVVSLTALRLSPSRTLLLPVLQLEGLRGSARRDRCRVMARQDVSASAGLLAAGAHFHGMLLLGLLLLVELLLPEALGVDVFGAFAPFVDGPSEDPRQLVAPALYLLGISVIEPLLVACGFALYLNRRVQLEGWDIDLAFRALARRADTRARRRPLAAALALACALGVALGVGWASPLRADPCAGAGFEAAKACAEAVVAEPDFGRSETVKRWRLRAQEETPESEPWLPGWVAELVAGTLEVALWAGLAAGVVALFMALSRHATVPPDDELPEGLPPVLFGLDLDPASLPEDLLAAVRAAFARGDAVGALSLLYRGALLRLADETEIHVPESATELECLALVRRAAPGERAAVFDQLTALWLRARYGDEPPAAERFESLCVRFAPAFAAAEERA